MPISQLTTLQKVLLAAFAIALASVVAYFWYSGWDKTHPAFKVVILGFTALFTVLAGWVVFRKALK